MPQFEQVPNEGCASPSCDLRRSRLALEVLRLGTGIAYNLSRPKVRADQEQLQTSEFLFAPQPMHSPLHSDEHKGAASSASSAITMSSMFLDRWAHSVKGRSKT